MNQPLAPTVVIVLRDGTRIPSPVKYLGWKQPTKNNDYYYHCWRVLNEGPFDRRLGDTVEIVGGTSPWYVECLGTGPRELPEDAA